MKQVFESLFAAKKLQRGGVLGMNRRNIDYIAKYNDRSRFPLVDNKLKTKHLAIEHGLMVPPLLGIIDNQHDVSGCGPWLASQKGFCIKPARGSGGKGILVIKNIEEGTFFRANGQLTSIKDIQRHISNILAGLFSLAGVTDVAIVEGLIISDSSLDDFTFEGVPDVRVIVFRGIPVMAMMRLACSASNGKANLHQGAIGVGIDIATGRAVNAVQNDRPVTIHQDTQQNLMNLQVPNWVRLLELSCECYDMTELGYLGVDLVLDKTRGPTLLELNARPGLSIQMANNKGLLARLKKIEAVRHPDRLSVADRIKFATSNFASI